MYTYKRKRKELFPGFQRPRAKTDHCHSGGKEAAPHAVGAEAKHLHLLGAERREQGGRCWTGRDGLVMELCHARSASSLAPHGN